MSKKARRQRRPNLPPEAFNTPMAATAANALSSARVGGDAVPQPATARRTGPINWQLEYSEVLGDLRRTAILAVIMMGGMGVLSFFLR